MEHSKSLTQTPALDLAYLKQCSGRITLLAALLVIIYFPTLTALVQMWWSSDDYSHGFLIPFISFYLAWMKREELRRAGLIPSLWGGAPLIVLAGLMLAAGKLGGIMLLQQLSLLVMIAGLVLVLAGRAWLKILAFPIAYLLFMIKLFGEGDDRLHWPFQLLAANIGVWLLHLLGFPAYQHGQYIELPRVTLDVAAACSGVRFLVSIIAIGIPLAYFTQKAWPRRIGLIGFAVLIALMANGLRVALIGVWTTYHGAEGDVHGPFHVLQGVFVSWIGFIALFAGAWLLGRRRTAGTISLHNGPRRPGLTEPALATGPVRLMMPWTIAMALLLLTGGFYYYSRTAPVPLRDDFSALPTTIGSWSGERAVVEQAPFRVGGADQEVVWRYRNTSGLTVTLYVCYFGSQEQGRELVNYQTSWTFHRSETELAIPSGSRGTDTINRATLKAGQGEDLVFFWYDLNGRMATGRYEAKILTLWNALILGRSNGALVAVSTPLTGRDGLEPISGEVQPLIAELIPLLGRYLDGQAI